MAVFFPRVILLTFCLIFARIWWFWGRGLGLGVLVWIFRVGVYSWWGLGPVVWGILGLLCWGSLYKHRRMTLGKKLCHIMRVFICSVCMYVCIWVLLGRAADCVLTSLILSLSGCDSYSVCLSASLSVILCNFAHYTKLAHSLIELTAGHYNIAVICKT